MVCKKLYLALHSVGEIPQLKHDDSLAHLLNDGRVQHRQVLRWNHGAEETEN